MESVPIRLTIELVPKTCWCSNVRTILSKKQWDTIRMGVGQKAFHRCEICGGQGRKHPVECHEVWHYDDANRVQTLVRMCALCPACHEVKHIGLAEVRGRAREATQHLAKVNGWTPLQAMKYVSAQFEIWAHRSLFQWDLDLSALKNYGVDLSSIKQRAKES